MIIMKFGGSSVGGADKIIMVKAGSKTFETMCRIDTPIEQEYYRYGGALSYVLCKMLGKGDPVGAR